MAMAMATPSPASPSLFQRQRPIECPPARVLEQYFLLGREHALLCVYMVLEFCFRHGLCDRAAEESSDARSEFVQSCYEALKTLTQDELKSFNEEGPWAPDVNFYKAMAIDRSKKNFGTAMASCPVVKNKKRPKPSVAPGAFGRPRRRRHSRGKRGALPKMPKGFRGFRR